MQDLAFNLRRVNEKTTGLIVDLAGQESSGRLVDGEERGVGSIRQRGRIVGPCGRHVIGVVVAKMMTTVVEASDCRSLAFVACQR